MSRKNTFSITPIITLILQRESGSPYALQVNLHKFFGLLAAFGTTLLILFIGTLFFFRELEINRKLLDRSLEAEVRSKLLVQEIATNHLGSRSDLAAAATRSALPATKIKSNDRDLPTDGAVATSSSDSPITNDSPQVSARVGELTSDCSGETCEVELSLVPTSAGITKGQLLLVLEAEIPRIGTGSPTTPLRKRYYLYPGGQTRDELPPEALAAAEEKSFHFTRGLSTHASFSIGKLMRPLAINAYLFDTNKNLISHERKVIENDE